MKKVEIGIVLLAIVALTMNLLLVPIGNILTVITFSLLSMFYFGLGFALFNNIKLGEIAERDTFKKIGQARIVGAVGAGFALAITVTGLLFRIQSWPGINLELGLICVLAISIVSAIKYFKDETGYYRRILIRTIIIGTIGMVFLFLPKTYMVELKYRNHPVFLEAYKKAMADPDNYDLWEEVRKEQEKISQGE